MRQTPFALLALATSLSATGARAAPDPKGFVQVTITPEADTWSTHDDKTVHGAEPALKVGIQPQAPDLVSYRHFRAYLRFDLATVPKGPVVKAELRLRVGDEVEKLGPPVKVVATALKGIGLPNTTCEWDEGTLNDTNGTTWNSLPQNLSKAPGDVWIFDVTKAAKDWLTGNEDLPDKPIYPNCGFHMYDPDYGSKDAPIERWVLFSSKEGPSKPELVVTIAKDLDGDGYAADVDCDESNPAIHPGALDVCDGLDNDCSGLNDDEVCDGADNDCDGAVDEGPDETGLAACPPGFVCANHACVQSCASACASPYDLKCEWDAAGGVWTAWGCKLDPGSPCFGWYMFETCKKGWNCQYGSCSSNCIDLCETDGSSSCVKDKFGRWHVALCGNFDADECLEPQYTEDCKVGADCVGGACQPGGCVDGCTQPGKVTCASSVGTASALVCKDKDGDGCLDTLASTTCKGGCVEPWGCILPGSTPPEDAGAPLDGGGASDVVDAAEADVAPDSGTTDVASEIVSDVALADLADLGGGAPDGAETLAGETTSDADSTASEVALTDSATLDAQADAAVTAAPVAASDSGCATTTRRADTSTTAWILAVGALALGIGRGRCARRPFD